MKFNKTTDHLSGAPCWKPTHQNPLLSGVVDTRLPVIHEQPGPSRFYYEVNRHNGDLVAIFDTLVEAKRYIRAFAHDMGYV